MKVNRKSIYVMNVTGNFPAQPATGLADAFVNPLTAEDYIVDRIQRGITLGYRRLHLTLWAGWTTTTIIWPTSTWCAYFEHIRNFIKDGVLQQAAAGYNVTWGIYTGSHWDTAADPYSNAIDTATAFFLDPTKNVDQLQMEIQIMPLIKLLKVKEIGMDNLSAASAAFMTGWQTYWNNLGIRMFSEAFTVDDVGAGPSAGGRRYALKSNPTHVPMYCNYDFMTSFDADNEWTVDPTVDEYHVIMISEEDEATLVDLHNRGFILGTFSDDTFSDEFLELVLAVNKSDIA